MGSPKVPGRGRKIGSPKLTTKISGGAAIMSAEIAGQHGRDTNELVGRGNIPIEPNSATDYYVYTIGVSDVVRYIGKGKGLRLYSHMKEVRNRLNRDYKLGNIGSRLQRNLTEAVISGAMVVEQIIVDNLTEKEAYKLEYEQLREYVLAGKREQLWNVIPPSIRTPQEFQDYKERLERNLSSRDRLVRYFSARTLADLIASQS
jgi:hypothetical protein